MRLLEEMIKEKGTVIDNHIVKVDAFFNHQYLPGLYQECAKEVYRLFKDEKITKVLTIEASGIALALTSAMLFDVPMLVAKKGTSSNLNDDVYQAEVYSYTREHYYEIYVSNKYLNEDDNVLIVDDFLANGNASNGLISLIKQANAKVAGIAIGIEKGFENGGKTLREQGYHVESLAIIKAIEDNKIVF
jgi:xanthine phosphoribosyltransferase